jgi:hypothetical protein
MLQFRNLRMQSGVKLTPRDRVQMTRNGIR